jgi:hypothetical protein
MAHLRDLDRPCAEPGCGARAVCELRNFRNETMAAYCRSHGRAAEKRLQAREDEEAGSGRRGFDVVGG